MRMTSERQGDTYVTTIKWEISQDDLDDINRCYLMGIAKALLHPQDPDDPGTEYVSRVTSR